MKTTILGLFTAALLLGGCGGDSSATSELPVTVVAPTPVPTAVVTPTPTPTATTPAQSSFAVPQDLHQAVPPAPPINVPTAPSAAQMAGSAAERRNFAQTKARIGGFGLLAASGIKAFASSPNPVVRFSTSLGIIDVELRPDVAPKNVANFLSYVNNGAYSSASFIHRSVPGFILQGGGYYYSGGQASAVPQQAPIVNEFGLSNVRGTLAMAKVSGNPNSATSQWFFNLTDNSANLDTQNGGSTVIGSIISSSGLAVMDAIAALPITNAGSPFDALPVTNYTSGALSSNNFIYAPIGVVASHPGFFNGEQTLGNGQYYLTFQNGNNFGYYTYLSDPNYIYHADLGYEYVFDAMDGKNGVYLYDFASSSFFYTSPSFPFPYLYDFTRNSVVYYYSNSSSVGHYTTGPRYFYDFNTKAVISK